MLLVFILKWDGGGTKHKFNLDKPAVIFKCSPLGDKPVHFVMILNIAYCEISIIVTVNCPGLTVKG